MRKMKKIGFLISLALLLFSCTNRDIGFDDYTYQSVYFPYQSPIRTLMLGDEVVGDNTIDREHAFSIGVSTGGVYENEQDISVMIELDPELMNGVVSEDGDTLELLPASYYEATFNEIEIPSGSYNGKVRVDLTDDFFADPMATKLNYVIPLSITGSTADTVLSGKLAVGIEDPDRRISDHWELNPKDYTLFAVKYINAYHGVYLLRGRTINTTAVPQDTSFYSTRFLTDNSTCKLTTNSLTESVLSTLSGSKTGGVYSAVLTFNESDQTVVVSQTDAASVVVNGSGVYYTKNDADSEAYNEKKHRTIYLDYTYEDGGETFHAMDSLVFLDTDMTFEEFSFSIDPNL
jgi:hypothetical protein